MVQLSKILLVSILIMTFLLLSGFVTNQQIIVVAQTDENNFVTYNNPTFAIRIQYPSDWGRLDLSFLENDSADIDFYPLDDTSGAKNVRIQVKTLPLQNMALDEYTNVQTNSIEGQLLESNATALADLPAHEIVFTNLGLKTMQIWTIKDDKIYTITYVAEEEDYQNDFLIAQRMIKSFEII
jgi:eukaryotic-like serine/threonine-protein kinase